MIEEQKRFKILKRTSYEEQISQENKDITKKTFLFGFSAVAAIFILSVSSLQNIDVTTKLLNIRLGLLNTGFAVYHLKDLIEAIAKKTMLQGKIEDINTELEVPENEESRGMRR